LRQMTPLNQRIHEGIHSAIKVSGHQDQACPLDSGYCGA
jgi:hypothetical protein